VDRGTELPPKFKDQIRRHKPEIIEELRKRPAELLTLDLIDRYTELSDHDRELLRCFASVFNNATIEWKGKDEMMHETKCVVCPDCKTQMETKN